MNESKQGALPATDTPTGRESRAEALLVEGLDEYFLGNFEQAIHLWTRVLFVDRNHARARAYINRARTAQSERLRRAEEMLHAAGELLDRGRLDEARRLLSNAEQASGADERVAALWARLEQVARSSLTPPRGGNRGAVVDACPVPAPKRLARLAAQGVAAIAIGLFVASVLASPAVREWVVAPPTATPPAVRPRPLDVPSGEAVSLVRARSLFGRGRLAEALRELRRIDSAGPGREEADRLRAEIQRLLLASRESTTAAGSQGERPR